MQTEAAKRKITGLKEDLNAIRAMMHDQVQAFNMKYGPRWGTKSSMICGLPQFAITRIDLTYALRICSQAFNWKGSIVQTSGSGKTYDLLWQNNFIGIVTYSFFSTRFDDNGSQAVAIIFDIVILLCIVTIHIIKHCSDAPHESRWKSAVHIVSARVDVLMLTM